MEVRWLDRLDFGGLVSLTLVPKEVSKGLSHLPLDRLCADYSLDLGTFTGCAGSKGDILLSFQCHTSSITPHTTSLLPSTNSLDAHKYLELNLGNCLRYERTLLWFAITAVIF